MVNGVLVERTVKEVIPAVRTNSDGLKKILEELVKQYKKQQDDMEKWKVRNSWVHTPSRIEPSAAAALDHDCLDHDYPNGSRDRGAREYVLIKVARQKKNNIQVVQQ